MTFLRTISRFVSRTLTIVALASAPIGTYYAYVAAREAVDGSPLQHGTAKNGERLVALSEEALAQRREDLEIQRGMLAALNRLLPEAERGRHSLERLAQLTEEKLAAIAAEQSRREEARAQRRVPVPSRPAPIDANSVAERIWTQMKERRGEH